ncbi:cell division protein SepF [Mycolicibacter nonchromogenicus]|uniref:Cell division protein SepF n=1 Tax=Mycolicibacter nonchromogenicus TaxID=1782 RepID=A0A1X1YVQ7_MYCNO|nr:cell division protein SepF [Mycolicibacter nonchromogenicus]ORW15176.1 cell division protein SepF [Mycolicibacter nonchromogenicus]
MSTLHKVKAYFGMAPMEDYDDDYYDDGDDRAGSRDYAPRGERFGEDVFDRVGGRAEGRYDERFEDGYDGAPGGYRGGYDDDPRYRGREFDRPRDFERRFASLRGSTRGALAMEPRRMAQMFDESSPLSKITTLRPKDYSEARTIGERFRDGTPVIMDLVSMDNADAKRLVDFAAGLAFALRGSFDKVATKVFLLSPADVDVTPEERRRIAETGFYAYR